MSAPTMDPDVITELDVIDAERAKAMAWVECAECGYGDYAMDMVYQSHAGDWLCWDDHRRMADGYETNRRLR